MKPVSSATWCLHLTRPASRRAADVAQPASPGDGCHPARPVRLLGRLDTVRRQAAESRRAQHLRAEGPLLGIRPVGDAYGGGAPLAEFQAIHFNWMPIHWEDECSLAGWFEDGTGNQWHTDQCFFAALPEDGGYSGTNDPDSYTWQGTVLHNLTMVPGTRRAASAIVTMQDRSGEVMEVRFEPVLVHRMKGLGYQHPVWGHGKWQASWPSPESWIDSELDPLALENIHIQQVVKATSGDRGAMAYWSNSISARQLPSGSRTGLMAPASAFNQPSVAWAPVRRRQHGNPVFRLLNASLCQINPPAVKGDLLSGRVN